MKRLLPAACAVLSLGLPLLAATAPTPFPQADSDLKPDPALHFGALPNGLRFVIMPNREPRERVLMRLVVLCGSVDEQDDERGLAHYLEHMAFNGSTHFASGTLIGYFQRNGMRFGGDANADTSFQRTVYKIDLPDHRPGSIQGALSVLSDFAGGLLLQPEMVAKERPVILSEMRTRDSVQRRAENAKVTFLLPETRYIHRFPIGDAGDIGRATRDQFVQIYHDWYRPERMAVVIVGDIDPAQVEAQVAAAFRGLTDRAPEPAEPDPGQVTAALGLRTGFDEEPAAQGVGVGIYVAAPLKAQPDTAEQRARHLIRNLAVMIMNRRLEALSHQAAAPLVVGRVSVREEYDTFRIAAIEANSSRNGWTIALGAAEQELRRALKYGFTAEEVREAVATTRSAYRTMAAEASTRQSRAIVDELVLNLLDHHVSTSPEDDAARTEPALDAVTPAECLEALRDAFAGPGRSVFIHGDLAPGVDFNPDIAAAYHRSEAVAVAAPAAASGLVFGYGDFGKAGRIVQRSRIDDLDITEVEFANGVRLNLKRTAFQADHVDVSVRIGTGRLAMTPDQRGLDLLAPYAVGAGGLGKHSYDELTGLLAGTSVRYRFDVRNDCLRWAETVTPQDLGLGLHVIAAYLVDAGYRPEAAGIMQRGIASRYGAVQRQLQGPLEALVPNVLAAGDSRFGYPPYSQIRKRTLDEVKTWVTPQFASGPIEVGIVGDFDIETAIQRVAETLGTLPKRSEKPPYAAERQVDFPARPVNRTYWIESNVPAAEVAVYWPTTDVWDIARTRRLEVLAAVVLDRLRLRLREKMGATYSPTAADLPSDTYSGYGQLVATAIVAPNRAEECVEAILAVAKELAEGGIAAEEFDRVMKPRLAVLRDSIRDNSYWIGRVVGECQEYPEVLDRHRSRIPDTERITAAELFALARTYLAPEKAFRFKVLPKTTPAAPGK